MEIYESLKIIDKRIKKEFKNSLFAQMVEDIFDFTDITHKILRVICNVDYLAKAVWTNKIHTHATCSIVFYKDIYVEFFDIEIGEQGIAFIDNDYSIVQLIDLLNYVHSNNIPDEVLMELEKLTFEIV